MKTEHEKLKWICDEIRYKLKKPFRISGGQDGESTFIIRDNNLADVREIIFTPEFKMKLADYLAKSSLAIRKEMRNGKSIYHGNFIDYVSLRLGENLDNPVSYLDNLLNKGTT